MAAENFDACLDFTLKYEGGFVDDPRDPGGATNMGVTRATLDQWMHAPQTVTALRSLTRSEAAKIYRDEYWDVVGGDDLPPGCDLAVFDFAVNSGPARARSAWREVEQKSPSSAIVSVCAERLAFLQKLTAYAYFGQGWSARVHACLAACEKLASADPVQDA